MCILANGIMLGYLGICGYSDWKSKEIPTFTMILFSISTVLLTIACSKGNIGLIAAGGVVGILFFGISKLTKEAIGYGDSWVITLLGIYLGGVKLLWVLFLASLGASLFSLFYLWKYHWKKSRTIPFVPFLFIAYLGVMLL
ncbi:MAG: prepilin peptidase [Tyzzerella sp.]|nr:prepilin peptidase [Tyzzerella sp.]